MEATHLVDEVVPSMPITTTAGLRLRLAIAMNSFKSITQFVQTTLGSRTRPGNLARGGATIVGSGRTARNNVINS